MVEVFVRISLVFGLLAHKLVWEALKRRAVSVEMDLKEGKPVVVRISR